MKIVVSALKPKDKVRVSWGDVYEVKDVSLFMKATSYQGAIYTVDLLFDNYPVRGFKYHNNGQIYDCKTGVGSIIAVISQKESS